MSDFHPLCPPPLTESPLSFLGKFFLKGLKMHKKRQKIEFLDLKRRFFSLAELGGTPSPPLTENQSEKKKVFSLAEKGGTPPPP